MTLTQITEKGIKDGEIVNADINASAAIAKSKLASLDIVNADINASAAIAGTKVAPDFGNQNIATTGNITASGTIHSTLLSSSQTGTGGILKLARTGTANGEYQFRMSNDSGTDCNLRIYDVKASATRFTISSDGEIGIGTTSPDRLFHVEGTNNVLGKFQNDQSICLIEFEDTDTTAGNRPSFGSDANNAVIYAGGDERMRIDTNGNVGIGTDSPDTNLHLSGDTPKFRIESTNTLEASAGTEEIGRIEFEGTKGSNINVAASMRVRQDGTWSTSDDFFSPTAFEFYTQDQSGTEITTPRMTIDSSGVLIVGSGANTATQRAAFLGGYTTFENTAGSGNPSITFNNDIDTGFLNPSGNTIAVNTGGSERARIDSSGRLLIGRTSPSNATGTVAELYLEDNTAYDATSNRVNGLVITNDSDVDGGFAGIELRASDGDGYVGTVLLKAIADGTNYSNNFVIQTRHGGNWRERLRVESDGDLRLSSDNASTNYGLIDGWNASGTGNFIISADHGTTGTNSSTDGSAIVFKTRAGERARIQHAGGISFNGDTAQANALDDYEEGTWTPELTSGYYSGETYSAQTGTYVKIGNQVTAWFFIQFNSMSTSGGEININTPFTAMTGSLHKGSGIVNYHNFSNSSTSRTLAIYQKNSTTMKFYGGGDNLFSATAHTSQNGKYLIGHFTFRTA